MPLDTAQPPIDYASGATRTGGSKNTSFRVALACAIFPAALGILITSLWLFTRWSRLVGFGIAAFFLGLLCFVVGGVALLIYFGRAITSRRRPVRPWLVRTAVAAAMLLANFPLCGVCISLARLNRVEVVNATGGTVSSFVVADASGQSWELGPVASGGRSRRLESMGGEGALTYTAVVNGVTTQRVIDPYVSSGMGGKDWSVTLNADGTASIR